MKAGAAALGFGAPPFERTCSETGLDLAFRPLTRLTWSMIVRLSPKNNNYQHTDFVKDGGDPENVPARATKAVIIWVSGQQRKFAYHEMEIAAFLSEPVYSQGAAACVVCKAALPSVATVRLRGSHLCQCQSCGSWTYLPRSSADGQAALHDNAAYFEHPYFKLRRNATPAQRRRCADMFARIGEAVNLAALRGQRWLDIGCDTGLLLKAAQGELGIVPVGIDVARRAVEIARQNGVDAYQFSIENAPAELSGFRVVTAVDLIEHVPDPGEFLRRVRDRMCPGGALYLETPNIRSAVYRFGQALARLTGGRPAGLIERLFPRQHIQYFTAESLAFLAERSGFEVVRLIQRGLPLSDIAASPLARLPIAVLQAFDRVAGTEILLCAVLRRPLDVPPASRE